MVKLRAGKPGQLTKRNYKVIFDTKWHLAKLQPFPKLDYSDSTYRNLVNKSASAENYFQEHDKQQFGYLKFIIPYLKRGITIADFGCGGGSNLDLLKGLSSLTIAIEPFIGYKKSLTDRGHLYFSSTKEVLKIYSGKIDLGISIHVIEHTKNPAKYLGDIYNALSRNSNLILFTPNLNDILLKLVPRSINLSSLEKFTIIILRVKA